MKHVSNANFENSKVACEHVSKASNVHFVICHDQTSVMSSISTSGTQYSDYITNLRPGQMDKALPYII